MAEGAYEAALKYSKQRKQFGKAISEFQAIQWKLADMATEIEAAKLLTFRAASLKDAGSKSTLESSMAKLYASEVAVRCANEGVQIHGGYGFIKDYPAEKFYRDVKLCTIGEGHERGPAAGDRAAVAEGLNSDSPRINADFRGYQAFCPQLKLRKISGLHAPCFTLTG